ncbi:Hypothetical protein A7982_00970 [Minicystis rosea]|nr:Hypothetical protein A7982_00970 [Minicystis rosea]
MLLTGTFGSAVDFGGGALQAKNGSIFLARLDTTGHHVFSMQFGGEASGEARAASDVMGNLYLGGYLGPGKVDLGGGTTDSATGNAFLMRLDAAGHHVWSRRFSAPCLGGYSNILGVAVAPSTGDVVVAGSFQGQFSLGDEVLTSSSPAGDRFLASFDATGMLRWKKVFHKSNIGLGFSVAVDAHGDIAVAGPFEDPLSFGGPTLTSLGGDDIFVVKLDADGNHLWSRQFGTPAQDFGGSVTIGPSGELLVTAEVQDALDLGKGPIPGAPGERHVLFAVFESNGDLRFSTDVDALVPDPGFVFVSGSGFDAAGNVTVSLQLTETYPNAVIAKLSASGDLVWLKPFDEEGRTMGSGAIARPNGGIVVVAVQNPVAMDVDGVHFPAPNERALMVVDLAP